MYIHTVTKHINPSEAEATAISENDFKTRIQNALLATQFRRTPAVGSNRCRFLLHFSDFTSLQTLLFARYSLRGHLDIPALISLYIQHTHMRVQFDQINFVLELFVCTDSIADDQVFRVLHFKILGVFCVLYVFYCVVEC